MLAMFVLLLQWPDEASPDRRCDFPREARAVAGWTVDVSCGPDQSADRALRGPARILFDQPLDLNRADAVALQVLPGIGPGRAAAIVAARSQRPLRTLSDLELIRGIGPKTVAGLGSWAMVDGGGVREY